jgi:hypothetical protein
VPRREADAPERPLGVSWCGRTDRPDRRELR